MPSASASCDTSVNVTYPVIVSRHYCAAAELRRSRLDNTQTTLGMSTMLFAPTARGVLPKADCICQASRSAAILPAPTARHALIARAAPRSRRQSVIISAKTGYASPSSVGGATELEALSSVTQVVPDSVLMASAEDIPRKAATVSAAVLGASPWRCHVRKLTQPDRRTAIYCARLDHMLETCFPGLISAYPHRLPHRMHLTDPAPYCCELGAP